MTAKPLLVAVDDQADNRLVLEDLLGQTYRLNLIDNGKDALKFIRQNNDVQLILLDVVMPGMSGYEVCAELKNDPATQNIPVIFLTGLSSQADEEYGLALGADDFIQKPFSGPIVLARIQNHLRIGELSRHLRMRNEYLESKILERTQSLIAAQAATIAAFCSLAETRDNETGSHILRTQHYVRLLAQRLQNNPKYAVELTDENIMWIFKSAPLHDIGKVGIPDAILQKPGKLTPEEWTIMQTHCQIGADVISNAESELGENSFLKFGKQIAHFHHERWDGTGYPLGLAGDDIPISARIMALADVYDALISKRCYKEAFSADHARELISAQKGKHFDPDIVEVFLEISDEFVEVAERFSK